VVGSLASLDRLLKEGEHWWCFPAVAEVGAFVAMYCTGQVSKSHQGVFAIFRLTAFDHERDPECKRYGSSSGYGPTTFSMLSLVRRIDPPLSSRLLRSDPVLRAARCVRRSFQGTFFALEAPEVKRLLLLTEPTEQTRNAVGRDPNSSLHPPREQS
jgi:hypothetical protein